VPVSDLGFYVRAGGSVDFRHVVIEGRPKTAISTSSWSQLKATTWTRSCWRPCLLGNPVEFFEARK